MMPDDRPPRRPLPPWPSDADLARFRPPVSYQHPRCVMVPITGEPLGEPLGEPIEITPGGLGDTGRPLGSD